MNGWHLDLVRRSEWICIGCFVLAVPLSFYFPVSTRRRLQIIAINVVVIALLISLPRAAEFTSSWLVSVLRDWLPAPLIVLAYHEGGMMAFPRADHFFERAFLAWDVSISAKTPFRFLWGVLPRWLDAALELSYLQCYPIVPSGVAVLYLAGERRFADQYWSIVLPAVFACYLLTPFFPAEPPRNMRETAPAGQPSLEPPPVRKLNLWVLGKASIQLNSFPSPHVAGAIAVSLAIVPHLPLIGAVYSVVALGITLGAVRGRYHYALDAALGAIVAVLAFLAAILT